MGSLVRPGWKRAGTLAAVLLLYTAITAAFWAPAWAQFTTHFVGDGGDGYVFIWNPWWLTHCLAHLHNPYYCDMQFAPFGVPLVFHCLTAMPSLVMAVLMPFLPGPLVYNLAAVGFCPIGGLCAFALARHVTRDTLAAIAGGAVFMLCPFLTSKMLGHMNLSCAAFLPLYTLCLLRTVDAKDTRWRIYLLLAFILILFSNEHTLVFAANVTVWYWLYRAIRSRQWREETGRFWWACKPMIVVAIVWGGVVAYYAGRYQFWPYRAGWRLWCPEPLNYLLPMHLLSFWRDRVAPPGELGWQLSSLELAVYLGWLVCPIAIAGLWCQRRRPSMRFMGCLLAGALVLSLGHKLQWHRETVRVFGHGVRLPMEVYRYLPVLGAVGQTGRYMAIGYMAMGVGVAGFIAHIRGRRGPGWARFAAVAIMIATCLDYGYRPMTVPVPTCAIRPGDGKVMDPRPECARSLYYQTLHGRPLVGGYISRPPPRLQKQYESLTGIGWFFQNRRRRGPPPSPQELRQALCDLDIEYVCVDRAGTDRRVLEAAGLRVVHENERDVTLMRDPSWRGPPATSPGAEESGPLTRPSAN